MDKEEVLKITKDLPPIIGIAPNAFSRIILADFCPEYSIVCFKYRGETDIIARDIEVFCVEKEDPGTSISKMNAQELLVHPKVQEYIKSKKDPHLLIYKPTKGVEAISYEMGWKVIGNSSSVKYKIENKYEFRQLLKKAGIEAITGETILYDDLDKNKYGEMVEKYGNKLVFQIAEMTSGGGTGTAFINSEEDFKNFKNKFDIKREKLLSINKVNVTRFMEGTPTSISACATKFGVVTGNIQTQILDIPEVRLMSDGSGLFSGHDFSFGNYSGELNEQAKCMARSFGEYIYKNLSYKGIFGLDLITDIGSGKVYPIECNPRYTDAFPLISEIHNSQDAITMDVFHIFEHMNVPYNINVDEISATYAIQKKASQIILETRSDDWTKVAGSLKAGVYKINKSSVYGLQSTSGKTNGHPLGEIHLNDTNEDLSRQAEAFSYLRPGYRFEQLKSGDEFLVTEGVPFKDTVLKAGARILRLIFAESILSGEKELTAEAKMIIEHVYKELDIVPSDANLFIENFFGLKQVEIEDDKYLENAIGMGADVVNLLEADDNFGYVRPKKIMWEMDFKGSAPIDRIRSVRMRKHLRKWIFNMSKYDLRYEVKEPLMSKDFMLWYEKFRTLLSAKEKANIKIYPGWLEEKKTEGKIPGGIFLYKGNRFIGGNIYVRSDNLFNVGFGACEKVENPNWGMGTIVDFLSAEQAKKLGYKKIRYGIDSNLYGHHLSTGLLKYKLNFGLDPVVNSKTQVYSTRFIRTDKFDDTVVFLGIKNNNYVFYVLQKNGSPDEDLKVRTDFEIVKIKI
ncbi:MAG: biotin carboxylase-like protein [Candidatus Woesebacteria bacterium GW2011_GWC1_38_13]|uniref:ATP-grasp domain protein n=4 Tax=Candidatus Woeseibacteriota TaxID=1752722 RepID=A0A0G0P3C5_9BACT|nr:MAG: ATP-grasp domain protein [Candidatus Woesebacteria bacterium GW2011_GWD1_38_10]KKQ56716.1 MAG: biotin carboxylase-like protein [Candidatus Woesebacteria bacterium GW2011_GWC1_38_13]KKQ83786.1 MAG: ATP-grasp domain protein [Candidatus Woesebacteria bacterium GW2011_GWA1_38_8]